MSPVTASFIRWLLTWTFVIWVVFSILGWIAQNWQLLLGIAAVPLILIIGGGVLKTIIQRKGDKSWNGMTRR